MEVFSLNVDSGAETVEAFNKRLADFCGDVEAPVINVTPSGIGAALVISLAVPEDIPMPFPAMLLPIVRPVTHAEVGGGLETTLSGFAEEIRSNLPASATPVDMRMIEVTSPTIAGYAVATFCLGAIEYEGAE